MEKRIKEYEFARLILRLSNQIVKNRDQHVRDLGLTTEQADSLQFFLSHKNAVIMDLKEHLGVTHQTARGIVQRMEIKGLIETKKIRNRCQISVYHDHGKRKRSWSETGEKRCSDGKPITARYDPGTTAGLLRIINRSIKKCIARITARL